MIHTSINIYKYNNMKVQKHYKHYKHDQPLENRLINGLLKRKEIDQITDRDLMLIALTIIRNTDQELQQYQSTNKHFIFNRRFLCDMVGSKLRIILTNKAFNQLLTTKK